MKTDSIHTITTSDLTEEQQAAFITGWEDAGGYTDDCEASPAPWCCPWCYQRSITVTGDTPEEWGGKLVAAVPRRGGNTDERER